MKKAWRLWVIISLAIVAAALSGMFIAAQLGAGRKEQRVQHTQLTEKEHDLQQITMAVTSGLAMPPSEVELREAASSEKGWDVKILGNTNEPLLPAVLTNLAKMCGELRRSGVSIASAEVLLRTDSWRDLYGRRLPSTDIARLQLGADAFKKIDWSGFDPMNFSLVADEFWLHEKLKQHWDLLIEARSQEEKKKITEKAEAGLLSVGGGRTP